MTDKITQEENMSIEIKNYGVSPNKQISKGPVSSGSANEYIPKEYRDVAKGMEQQFIEYMISQMEKTTGNSDKSVSNSYYKSLLNTERAKVISEHNAGLGLQEMILEQIYPKKFRNKEAFNQYKKQTAIIKHD